MKMKTIAFVGNPNVGKSAWINQLANGNLKVGNWAGVTVRQEEAIVNWNQNIVKLVDLPGIYQLSDVRGEEAITSKFLKTQSVDCIINVVDTTNLERNLYLTIQLTKLKIPMIVVFNFMDEVEKYHIQLNIKKIQEQLELPIFLGCIYYKENIIDLKKLILQQLTNPVYPSFQLLKKDISKVLFSANMLWKHVHKQTTITFDQCIEWILYLCEENEDALRALYEYNISPHQLQLPNNHLTKMIYQKVDLCMNYVSNSQLKYKKTRKLDRFFLHPVFGKISMLFILFFSVYLIFHISNPCGSYIEGIFELFFFPFMSQALQSTPQAVQNFFIQGVGRGITTILSFIPLIAIYNIVLSILEESGYMARVVYHFDKYMNYFSLNGKSFLSFLIGFGCNVPAIYSTRTIDNEQQRKRTAILVPFMSCGARLPIFMIFSSVFFKEKETMVVVSLYSFGIFIALCIAYIISIFDKKKKRTLFLFELNAYRIPKLSHILKKVKNELISYIKKAFTVVLFAVICIWGLSYYPNHNVKTSYISTFSQRISRFYEPLGFGTSWECVAALPTSILAKETILAFLSQILIDDSNSSNITTLSLHNRVQEFKNLTENVIQELFFFHKEEEGNSYLKIKIQTLFIDRQKNLRVYCYLIYILLMVPCIMVLQAVWKEFGWKFFIKMTIFMFFLPYVVSFFIYQIFSIWIL